MLLYRFDVCVDLPVDNDRLIVRRGRSVSGVKYVIAYNRFGRIESQYFGSIDSDEHGVAYDQKESDKYKREVGEFPALSGEDAQASQNKKKRTRPRDNAELIIDGKRTKFEARRVFKDLPKVYVLQTWDGPFDNWEVWEISETMELKNDALFWMYLDCVRWRGVAGANLFLKFHGFKELPKMEKTLELLKADWWQPRQFRMSVIKSLKKCGLWQFLTQ